MGPIIPIEPILRYADELGLVDMDRQFFIQAIRSANFAVAKPSGPKELTLSVLTEGL